MRMTHVLTPNFKMPQLSVAPTGCGPSPESVRAAREDLRLLVVDASTLAPDERLQLMPRDSEIRNWYVEAADHGVGLIVLRMHDRVELYSTRQDRDLACSPPLIALAQRCHTKPELSRVRVVPRRGSDVANHLFALAAGLGMTRGKAKVGLARIDAAYELASRAGAMSPTVDSLFRAAIRVGHRVDEEALVGHPNITDALREVADIGAARIVEEELLHWKAEQAQLFRSMSLTENLVRRTLSGAVQPTPLDALGEEEAPSGVRIRVAPDISNWKTLEMPAQAANERRGG